jgi:outer membrane receptor protein involved in Fe transport
MSKKLEFLKKAEHRRLFASTALAVLMAGATFGGAWAQTAPATDQAEEETEETEEVVVTGSRIVRPALEGVISGASIGEEEIEIRGFANTLDILNDLPFVGTGLTPVGGQAGFGAGAAFTDVLDLGSARTLTLINGRRFVSANQASLFVGGNATGAQVDLNSIPSTLIERIDVVRGGQGGVAYGTDGIGGVVNAILKDNFDGFEIDLQGGISSRGDAGNYRTSATYGKNLLNNRANFTVSFEYNKQRGLTGDQREFSSNGRGFLTQPLGVRRPGFVPLIPTQSGFLPAAIDDLNSALFFDPGGIRTGAGTDGGAIFRVNTLPNTGVVGLNPTLGNFTNFFSGVTQLVPGGTGTGAFPTGAQAGASAAALASCGQTFVCFAPSSLPAGVSAASVISALAPTAVTTGASAAQLTALAVALLQQNRETPREFFQRNPNINPNLFLGQFSDNFPEIPNTDPATSALFPSLATPLRFNSAGSLVPFNLGSIAPNTGAQLGSLPGAGDGFFRPDLANLLTEQDRYIGFATARYDITERVRFSSEFLATSIQNVELANGPSANFVTTAPGTSPENVGIFIRADNAFLTADNRAALVAAGIPLNPAAGTGTTAATANGFVLSRSNADLLGANPTFTDNLTFRTSNILTADLNLFGREFVADASFTYGRVRGDNIGFQFNDIAFNLAADAVINPATGQAVCRAQLTPPNARANILQFPDEAAPVATQALIDACRPLNLFGENRFSQEARDYVVAETVSRNVSQQFFAQATLTGDLIDLPAGPLGVSTVFEWRRETLDFSVDQNFASGRTRAVGIVSTAGEVSTFEGAFEFRAPIFGNDFKIPWIANSFTLEGGVRAIGNSATGRDVIWTGGGTWSPIEGISFRGNRSRTARAASIVELFLSPQGAFFNGIGGDPCSFGNITNGPAPAIRARNCAAQVEQLQAAGTLPATFSLASYQSLIATLPGVFVGNDQLTPEISNSWNIGVNLRPSFIPNLVVSVDYIDLLIRDSISLAAAGLIFTTCFDSPNFPDVSSEVGVNTCDLFQRNPTNFQPQAITGTSINLGALELQQLDATITYNFGIAQGLGLLGIKTGTDLGRISLRGDVSYTRTFATSSNGTFSDIVESAGTIARPDFQTRFDVSYRKGPFTGTFQWFYEDPSVLDNLTPDLNDAQNIFFFGPQTTFNVSTRWEFNDHFSARFVVNNITDRNALLDNVTGINDPIGRRFVFGVVGKF